MDASHEKVMFSLWSAICMLSQQAIVFTFIPHLSKNYLFCGLRYSLYLKPLSLKSISQNMAYGKKVAILDVSAGLFQMHMMLQSNCRYFHCCDLFNKTFLLHWSKECIYFLEHVEASFPSSTQSGILPPSCVPPPASHAPCFMSWRQAEVVLEKEEWVWLDILCHYF